MDFWFGQFLDAEKDGEETNMIFCSNAVLYLLTVWMRINDQLLNDKSNLSAVKYLVTFVPNLLSCFVSVTCVGGFARDIYTIFFISAVLFCPDPININVYLFNTKNSLFKGCLNEAPICA